MAVATGNQVKCYEVEGNCPVGTATLYARSKIKLLEWKKMGVREEAGDAQLISRTNYERSIQMDCRANLVCDKRNACGQVTGIANL